MQPHTDSRPIIRVVVADDHDLVRMGIEAVLSSSRDIEVIGSAKDGEQLISLVTSSKGRWGRV